MSKPRLRFAPSPTGSPHVGNIRTAVFNYLYCRHTGGTFILRIEDTDRERYVEGSLEEIMLSLRWMGMDWDEGPEVGGDYGPYFQSQRLDIYARYAEELIERGRAYRCYCTKERLEELRKYQESNKLPLGYDRRCRDLSPEDRARLERENPEPVIRFAMKLEGTTEFDDVVRGHLVFDNALQDDFVIIKSDGYPTYNFANVIDDHLMEITHVIRGEEFISSTPKHVQMYEAFGWETPVWVSVPLILDEQRRKLSKRSDTQTRFVSYIEDGYLPEAMLNFLATMGWSSGEDKKIYTREELIEQFTLEGISTSAAVFDLARLNDLQGEHVRLLSVDDLANRLVPFLQAANYVGNPPTASEMDYLKRIVPLIQPRLVLLKDAPDMTLYFYRDDFDYEEKGARKYLVKDTTPGLLEAVAEKLESLQQWFCETIELAVREAGASLGMEGGQVIHPVRVAVTGRTFGPGLFELMDVLGKDRCTARLRRAAAWARDRLGTVEPQTSS
ncbi:MAG: glutamate--tRNA ligase [Armatimonadota bacterium]|nr:glutamate--tRNA ligase [Armatimonadota bacterium]